VPEFSPDETLYRRYREKDLVLGRPTPLGFKVGFAFKDGSGQSVNRSEFSEPKDVLEPDCCGGTFKAGFVVLVFIVKDVPEIIKSGNESECDFRFRLKHVPKPLCFAHSEIWCNQSGIVDEPYEVPPKNVRDRFRGELLRRIRLPALHFTPAE